MERQVELLAPAGSYDAFLGALNAGADAVYIGGDRYSARAYADNFDRDEAVRAIRTAHLQGRRLYLAVNTLMKEDELDDLYDWLLPYYEAGVDGVIVQDIGVFLYLREHFKDLPLHASTQMAVTGSRGAAFLKKHGAQRIVPARELQLTEICRIKEQTGLEIECFIHGAMCYSYSGQCLFSSMLGGRSGNRGRCAQPCRLPYRICAGDRNLYDTCYPLSLKDMCTLPYVPRLIEAGIDSFKIEGRMKKAEYAAGVTALYRKYIDLYYRCGADGYHVEDHDMDVLKSLYIRTKVQNGYYERRNGRQMITLDSPGYAGCSGELLGRIRERFIGDPDRLPVSMTVTLRAGQKALLELTAPGGVSARVSGAVVQQAQKMPLTPENVVKQMSRTGGSGVRVEHCDPVMDGPVFLPVGELNALRRDGIRELEANYILSLGLPARRYRTGADTAGEDAGRENGVGSSAGTDVVRQDGSGTYPLAVDVCVASYEQLAAAAERRCRRIYVEGDLFLAAHERVSACMKAHGEHEYYLALPYVLRASDEGYLDRLASLAEAADGLIAGFLARNYEGAAFAAGLSGSYRLVPDAGLYVWNRESLRFWSGYAAEYTVPYELNGREVRHLTGRAAPLHLQGTMVVYGRLPLMVTANCIRKTSDAPKDVPLTLKDRMGADFPVETNCTHCYNIIYNSVPYSLHTVQETLRGMGVPIWRYDFTTEPAQDCIEILEGRYPYASYTTGHFKRGVE